MKPLLITLCFLSLYCGGFSQNDSAVYYFQKALEEHKSGRLAVADNYLSKSIGFNKDFTAAYIAKGKVNLSMRRVYDALQSFSKANELDPANEEVIKELAELYFNNRQYQQAMEFVKKCKTCSDADRMMGLIYYNTEDYGKALSYLEKAAASDKNDALTSYTLGRTFLELEDEKKAITHFVNAINSDNTRNVWMYELALIYYSQEQYAEALKYFHAAAQAGYNTTNDFNENLGFAQLYARETDNGLQTLTSLLERKPNNKELLGNIASALYYTAKYDEAISYYDKLLTLDQKNAAALYMAGMAFQKKGDKEKGQKMCDKAIEMDPSLAKNRQKRDLPMGL